MRHPAREAAIAGQARVLRKLLAETNGPNTTSAPDRRKVGRREAGSEAARRSGRWPRESRKARSRVGIEFRRELAAGAGGSFRQQMARVTERRLPWSRRTRPGPVSTWVTNLQGRAEAQWPSLITIANLSCQRRQLRSSCLVAADLRPVRAYATEPGDALIGSRCRVLRVAALRVTVSWSGVFPAIRVASDEKQRIGYARRS